MASCPSCGFEHEGSFKFCPECATPLVAPARPVAEELKVVTALFCDLVGFTATSESADPADLDKMLAAYFSMARARHRVSPRPATRAGPLGLVDRELGEVSVLRLPDQLTEDPIARSRGVREISLQRVSGEVPSP
jgi:hypothetical protein